MGVHPFFWFYGAGFDFEHHREPLQFRAGVAGAAGGGHTRPWTESREAFASRLKQIVATINDKHDVDGLCRELPMRISKLIEKKGGKLRK